MVIPNLEIKSASLQSFQQTFNDKFAYITPNFKNNYRLVSFGIIRMKKLVKGEKKFFKNPYFLKVILLCIM
jgi:hypothetical protein